MVTEPTVRPDVLVVGAASQSLGRAIVNELADSEWDFGKVVTAGVSGEEQIKLDLLSGLRIGEVLTNVKPDIVVCTAGINVPVDLTDAYLAAKMHNSFEVNVTGPMNLLRQFVSAPVRPERGTAIKKFVAISSNSARIARRNSVAYCASKAALSMALRVAARELADDGQVMVWGYEPGLLDGTPMSREVYKALSGGGYGTAPDHLPMHRMRGVPPEGIPPEDLARRIVLDLATFSYACNGVMFPFDAGEQ